jgi:phospholipid/cholesterol/gamma-HCH transport system substrate-binding protein
MYSGINVGTVSEIQLVTDTSVVVRLLIKDTKNSLKAMLSQVSGQMD